MDFHSVDAKSRTEETASDLRVRIGAAVLRNPIMPASGCFGPELGELIRADRLGAVVTKTVFATARSGNPPDRVTEIPMGMVNSVGIPSVGPQGYLETLHPRYLAMGAPVVVSVGGLRVPEYAQVVRALDLRSGIYELNVSCPNLDMDGVDIGADPGAISQVVEQVLDVTELPIVVKLPPMVASIAECASAAQRAGASAVCVANSVPVLALRDGRPVVGNGIGGLSGPSVRPIVARLVWLAARAVDIPVIACGGASTLGHVLDYLRLGASAVQVGTAHFANPNASVEIVDELEHLCARESIGSFGEFAERLHVGAV